MFQSSWATVIRTVWKINPAIAVYMAERFKSPVVQQRSGSWFAQATLDVLDTPEALRFLIGDKLDLNIRRDLKVLGAPEFDPC
jgi:phosphatidylinositol 4-kinase